MALTITISRLSLGLEPLVVVGSRDAATGSGASGLWIPGGGYTRPRFATRRTFAPDSAYDTRMPLAAVVDEGTWTLTVRVSGVSAADLDARRRLLHNALAQWRYLVRVSLDGVVEDWTCGPTTPVWPESAGWARRGHQDRAQVVIPVQPRSA